MPATQSRSDSSLSANFIQQFDQAHEQAKSVFAAQKELLNALEQINEHWCARARSEAELATAMANKLAAVRSMPDMTTVYQDWFNQRMQRCVEDSNHVFADVQKLIRTGSRLTQNGNGRG
jgi:Phasin protein